MTVRESIRAALKAAVVIFLVVAGVSIVTLLVQAVYFKDPALHDSDGDGFLDLDELSWWTDWLNPHDNPFTSRILPLLLAAAVLAVVLILGKVHSRRRVPELVSSLVKKASAMRAAVSAGNRGNIDACKAGFDAAIADVREGTHPGMLQEPAIQEILVEFEVFCLDAKTGDGGGSIEGISRDLTSNEGSRARTGSGP